MCAWEQAFRQQLVAPQDWFGFWRLNCRLATFHSHIINGNRAAPPPNPEGPSKRGYEVECKWKFLKMCQRLGIAHTSWLEYATVVCKNRNEEGGLGYQAFKNASVGGDWIIQEKLTNSRFVDLRHRKSVVARCMFIVWTVFCSDLDSLLPDAAPLSTFRVITGSWGGLEELDHGHTDYDKQHPVRDAAFAGPRLHEGVHLCPMSLWNHTRLLCSQQYSARDSRERQRITNPFFSM